MPVENIVLTNWSKLGVMSINLNQVVYPRPLHSYSFVDTVVWDIRYHDGFQRAGFRAGAIHNQYIDGFNIRKVDNTETITIMPTIRITVPFLLNQPRGKKLLWSSK